MRPFFVGMPRRVQFPDLPGKQQSGSAVDADKGGAGRTPFQKIPQQHPAARRADFVVADRRERAVAVAKPDDTSGEQSCEIKGRTLAQQQIELAVAV